MFKPMMKLYEMNIDFWYEYYKSPTTGATLEDEWTMYISGGEL